MNGYLASIHAVAALCGCATGGLPEDSPAPAVIDVARNLALSADEIDSAVELARRVGLAHVDQIRCAGFGEQGHGPPILVRELVVMEPTVVRCRSLDLGRIDSTAAKRMQPGAMAYGSWFVYSPGIREVELRRVSVGDRHAEFVLNEGVSYDEAAQAVAKLVGGSIGSPGGLELASITSVGRPDSRPIKGHEDRDKHDLVEVWTSRGGVGEVILMCIEEQTAILVSVASWIE